MTLTRPLASIDIETTGTDPVMDRIISFGVVVLHPDGKRNSFEQMFNPGISISPGAMAVHGITDAMVADKPPFKDFAAKIRKGLEGKDLLGYNLRSLDLPMLDEELRRCGMVLDISKVAIVDAFGIFAKKEPRDLTAAVKKFCNRNHADAHGALADAAATVDVLMGQLCMYDMESMPLDELATFSKRDELDFVDLSGKLYRDADGDICFNFGAKTRGKKVKQDIGFAHWVMGKDFPGSTKDALRAEMERLEAHPRPAIAWAK